MIGSWIFFYSSSLCLLIGIFIPLIFNVTIDMVVFVFTILIFLFYSSHSYLFPFSSSFASFWDEFFMILFTFSVGLLAIIFCYVALSL